MVKKMRESFFYRMRVGLGVLDSLLYGLKRVLSSVQITDVMKY